MRSLLKLLANKVGYRLPRSTMSRLSSALNYVETGLWAREHGLLPARWVSNRVQLIGSLAASVAYGEVLYMEFGVWKGETTRLWSGVLRNPNSRLHGFDSFEGLPETWNSFSDGCAFAAGHFSTGGSLPQITDPRVTFYKGWFTETLPKYEFRPSPVFVLFMDSDLYSSTNYVLKTLAPQIKFGTIIYFDDFWNTQHEQKAFTEFLAETGMKFECLAADHGMRHIAFRRIG
jgi:hypothetical protein